VYQIQVAIDDVTGCKNASYKFVSKNGSDKFVFKKVENPAINSK
jgi:hypothetical protein